MEATTEKEFNGTEWNTFLNEVTDGTTEAIYQLQEVAAWASNAPDPDRMDQFVGELGLINETIQAIAKRNKHIIRRFDHANHLCCKSERRGR